MCGDSSVDAVQQDYGVLICVLRSQLDPGSKPKVVQDFWPSLQKSDESVSDFISCIEKIYHIAYGKDDHNPATSNTLLYGQLSRRD